MVAVEAPVPHIAVRVDTDAGPGRWLVACQTCGVSFAADIPTDDITAVAIAAMDEHRCADDVGAAPAEADRLPRT